MINIPKGTKDLLPQESYKWHYIDNKVAEVARIFCLHEVRTPTFEHTELFCRGVGDTTDIVNKEMYTFLDKGERSISLKPEGTAGVARCYIENSLSQLPQPLRMYYKTPVFRYERPQAGRLREHHQFGVEMYGVDSPMIDVEVMLIARTLFNSMGIDKLCLSINSIGCPVCRAEYNRALKEYLSSNLQGMCNTCKERFNTNPLRILDCKEENCKRISDGAPSILDYLCDDCKAHHNEVMRLLDNLGVEYTVDSKIVRGLDYYTKTVFEFVSDSLGAKSTVCGGGRYNNLVEQVGGKPCPAVGFGMGIERLVLLIEALGLSFGETERPQLYITSCGTNDYCFELLYKLRQAGIAVETDTAGRSVKAQMKYADKINAEYTVVIGDNEIVSGIVTVKNMKNGECEDIALGDLVKFFLDKRA